MKENKIIIANDGLDKNVMVMMPPMCFTLDNARRVVQVLDQALRDIENDAARVGLTPSSEGSSITPAMDVPLHVITENNFTHASDEEDEDDDPVAKRPRYEEMDWGVWK